MKKGPPEQPALSKKEALDLVTQLYSINSDDIESIEVKQAHYEKEPRLEIHVSLYSSLSECPNCQNSQVQKHGKMKTRIKHNIHHSKNVDIILYRQRFRCPECGKTFMEKNPFSHPNRRISYELVFNVLEDLKELSSTFSATARRFNLSSQEVMDIFDAHVRISRHTLPRCLLIDENYAIHLNDSDYILVLYSFDDGEIVDVLPDRKKRYVENYFLSIPLAERSLVEYVGIDMSGNFKSMVHEALPNATICVDHYHVIQELGRRLEEMKKREISPLRSRLSQVRKSIRDIENLPDSSSLIHQEDLKTLRSEKYDLEKKIALLKNFLWMVYKDSDNRMFDPSRKGKYNRKLGATYNYSQIRTMLLSAAPSLEYAIQFRRELNWIYEMTDRTEASEPFDELIRKMEEKGVPREMHYMARTLKNWKTYILNSLEVHDVFYSRNEDGDDRVQYRRLTNGPIESVNSRIKTIKKNANGFRNFPRMRNRIMYSLNKSDTYHADPIAEKLYRKKKDKSE